MALLLEHSGTGNKIVVDTDKAWECTCPGTTTLLAATGTACGGACSANCATCHTDADTCLTCLDGYYDLSS